MENNQLGKIAKQNFVQLWVKHINEGDVLSFENALEEYYSLDGQVKPVAELVSWVNVQSLNSMEKIIDLLYLASRND